MESFVNRATCLLLAYACVSPLSQCVAQTDDESAKASHKPRGLLTFTITDRRVIQSGSSDNSYNQAPAVVETASGNYLLSYKKGTNHVNNPYVVLRGSSDLGATWGPELVQWNTSSPDPALVRTPLGRDLIIEFGKQNNSGTSGAAYARSTDDGSN